MKLITTFEQGRLSIGEQGDLSPLEADALAAAESALPPACLEWGRSHVKFRQFCGVFQVPGQFQIEVLPKVFPYQTPEQQRASLITMLNAAGDLSNLDTSRSASLGITEHHLLDVFIRHFLKLLDLQLQQGLLKDYCDLEENLHQVRGRIDLNRQIRENLLKPQRLACRFSELVTDIPVNKLLHSALRRMTQLASAPVLKQRLQSMRLRFAGVGLLQPGDILPEAEDLNRMQSRYAEVVQLARLFLQDQFLDARSGQHQVFSLLFNMNQLFERFAATRLRPEARKAGLRLIEQGPRRYLGEDDTGKSRLLMRPDISLINEHNKPEVILDAKWKLLNKGSTPLASLNPADLYQVSAYASSYRCRDIRLLLPEQANLKTTHQMTLNLETPVRLSLVPVSLSGATTLYGA